MMEMEHEGEKIRTKKKNLGRNDKSELLRSIPSHTGGLRLRDSDELRCHESIVPEENSTTFDDLILQP